MGGRPETKQYWIDKLSEYWDSGLTIQEYCELKEVSYESARRWIALLQKERDGKRTEGEALELVDVSCSGNEYDAAENPEQSSVTR